jgi:phage-related protein
MKNLTWLADSLSNVKSFPAGVQDDIGYALYAAQLGELSVRAKPLHGLGGHVMEIAAHDASGTYRAVYTVSIGESIYVIHAFQKKSKAGIATPKSERKPGTVTNYPILDRDCSRHSYHYAKGVIGYCPRFVLSPVCPPGRLGGGQRRPSLPRPYYHAPRGRSLS